MLKEKEAVVRRALIFFDAILMIMVFALTYYIRLNVRVFYKLDLIPFAHVIKDMAWPSSYYLLTLIFLVPLWCIVLYWNGMYDSMRTKSYVEVVWILIKSIFIATFVFGAIVFIFKLKFVSRLFFIFFVTGSSFVLMIEKIIVFSIMHYVRRQGYNFRRLLVVGIGPRAAKFIQKVHKHPEWGLRVEGVLDYDKKSVGLNVENIGVRGTLVDLEGILHSTPIDEVVFIIPRSGLGYIEDALVTCETEGVKTTIAVDLFELKIARSRQTEIDGIPLLTFETTRAEEWELFIKRGVDIIASGLGLLMISPLLLFVALLIKLTSPGPVLFLQKRLGLNGRTFIMYKFRTMYTGAHQRIGEFADLNMMSGPVFKVKNDPRITLIGKYLRKFSIDELPQLYNVFIGHMSLVGPRPPLHKEMLKYETWHRRRLSMRPGLTCLWQISGRNKIGFDDWMKLDMEYLDNWSLHLDFMILIKTIPVVLFGIGAY